MDKVQQLLKTVDYVKLNSNEYVPSDYALKFINFVKLMNQNESSINKTPAFHYKMLDDVGSKKQLIANLCFRGSGKTTLKSEMNGLYLGAFQHIDGFGDVNGFLYISDSVDNGVKTFRENIEHRYNNNDFIKTLIPKAKFTENKIEFTNAQGKNFMIRMYGAKSGVRGVKIYGQRPVLAIIDDVIQSDEDANSPTIRSKISNMLNKAVKPALDPTRRKIIMNGTPFNQEDLVYKAIESGAWHSNVYPVCEKFPCSKEEFNGAWEDRFSYEFVRQEYETAKQEKKLDSFYQEYMLQIMSEEERLIPDDCIQWYERKSLIKSKSNFNFYITTDFATSEKQSADYSVISVWAVNNNGDYYWVDGICKRQTMDKNIEDLFSLVQAYSPQSVGIEITGQQGGFINWIKSEMMNRNVYFNIAREKGKTAEGIRPSINKLSRFNLAVPLFKANKMYFPKEMENTDIMNEFINELRMATINGLKGKDDCIDTISMLMFMHIIKPSAVTSHSTRQNSESPFRIYNYSDENSYSEIDLYSVN